MKLCFWNRVNTIPNFGDVLNPYIWDRLLPNVFDNNADSIFIGIGTLLEKGMGEKLNIPFDFLANDEPLSRWIIVFGSGAGYSSPPKIDSRWSIYCLRGPLTADMLGLDRKFAVTDPAILIRRIYHSNTSKTWKFSVMPHHSNANPTLKSICNEIGFHYINPLDSIETILESISRTEILLSEALHGAIVADALRTPWIPIKTNPKIFSFKWEDWCNSVFIDYKPILTSDMINRIWVNTTSMPGMIKQKIKYKIVERNLKNIGMNSTPILSSDSVIENLTQELEIRLGFFKKDLKSKYL